MTEGKKKRGSPSAASLRREAERRLGLSAKKGEEPKAMEAQRLLHELRTHQIELEMQNEELRRAQQELEESRQKYADLYDMAPVGYFSLDRNSLILELNLTGAEQSGRERRRLRGTPFSRLVLPGHRDLFYRHLREVFSHGARRSCELGLLRPDGKGLFVRIESIVIRDGASDICLTTVSDITEEGRLRDELVGSRARLEQRSIELEREVKERKKNERAMRKALCERETLLRELYHRTKNNMNVISGLITLQTASLPDSEALGMFRSLQDRIASMSLVHQKLYQSGDLSNLSFDGYLRDLAKALVESYGMSRGRVSLRLDVDSFLLSIDTVIPCGLIMNELISNSLKYAFPGGREGEIAIEARKTRDGEIRISYRDNGVGLPEGSDMRSGSTLGMKLVKRLVEGQLGGRVELVTGAGARFVITFHEPHYRKRI